MRSVLLLSIALLLAGHCAAQARQIELSLRTASGAGVADAVVTFTPAAGGAGKPGRLTGPRVMAQHNIAFDPHVLLVPVGAQVSFPNRDKVRHHVYSFSGAKRFELKLYGRDETHTVLFDKPGVVALGCNIHDRMSGFIVVVDTPYAAKSDASGAVILADVPDGPGALAIWQSDLKAPHNSTTRRIEVKGDMRLAYTLDLRPPAHPMPMPAS